MRLLNLVRLKQCLGQKILARSLVRLQKFYFDNLTMTSHCTKMQWPLALEDGVLNIKEKHLLFFSRYDTQNYCQVCFSHLF